MAKTDTVAKRLEKGIAKSSKVQPVDAPQTNLLLRALDRMDVSRVILLLCLLIGISYANSLGGDFVHDDIDQILKNPDIRSWDNLSKAFTTHVWQFRERPEWLRIPIPPPYYRPLFTVLFTVEYQLFGIWQQGWHLVSVLLHIFCSIGVFFVLMQLSRNRMIAVITAAIFAVYSIHVESVSWISGVTDPLFGTFFLWAFYFYLRYKEEQKTRLLIYSTLLFAGAAFSKETALTFVPLIFVFEIIGFNHDSPSGGSLKKSKGSFDFIASLKKAVVMSLPYAGVVVVYLLARFLVLGSLTWYNPAAYHGPRIHILWTLPWVVCTYLLHLLFPFNMSIAYATDYVKSPASASFIFPTLALLIITGSLIYYHSRISKAVWQAFAFLVVPLLLVFDIRQLSVEYLIADRYLYLSVVGFGYLIAMGIAKLADKEEQRIHRQMKTPSAVERLGLSSALVIILLTFSIVVTTRENQAWADGYSLWAAAARVRPNFWATHYNAGLELIKAKRFAEARDALLRAADITAAEPTVFNELGQAYMGLGENSRAIESFKRALDIDPETFEALNNLGTIYFNSGDFVSAERYFKSSLSLKPQAVSSRFNLAMCYSRQNRFQEAIPELENSAKYAPDDGEVLYELGLAYEKVGRKTDALATWQKASALKNTEALRNKINDGLNRLRS
ncbi:MAG: tetratricopeptide repeat protein [Acidobacteriota bacterium]